MDFFQKLGNTLSNTGKDIAKKTKDMSDISKLNHEITKQQELINRTYTQIGKLYFENYSNLDYADLKELCDSIKEANKKIEDFKLEIRDIKGIINCPGCNKEIPNSTPFCAFCGYKLNEVQTNVNTTNTENVKTENTTTGICPNCGKPVSGSELFCGNCGFKLNGTTSTINTDSQNATNAENTEK